MVFPAGSGVRILLLGAPGAGKSTQARFICEAFGIPQISTGDMLRAAMRERTPLGVKIEDDMKAGNLVSDSLVIELAEARLRAEDCRGGFLFDGFPRTLAQAKAVRAAGIAIDHVLEFDVPDAEIVGRMSGRRVHPASGRSYHINFNPPRVDGVDDVSGESLVQRDDDRVDTVMRRLEIFRKENQPLSTFYSDWVMAGGDAPKVSPINGVGAVSAVRELVFSALNRSA